MQGNEDDAFVLWDLKLAVLSLEAAIHLITNTVIDHSSLEVLLNRTFSLRVHKTVSKLAMKLGGLHASFELCSSQPVGTAH